MITRATRKYLASIGAIGGANGTGDAKRRSPEQARQAARRRWALYRAKKKSVDERKPIA